MKNLFIAGIPAMGKTFIGDFLESNYGYSHLNLTSFEKSDLSDLEKEEFKKKFGELKQQGRDTVITWGFGPLTPSHQDILEYILKNSVLIWLDGNRENARKAFIKRGGIEVEEFDKQVDQIDKSEIIKKLNPIIINTLNDDITYKNSQKVVDEINRLIDSNS